ncbi:MAG: hypothetical protein GF344_01805, partial [Chitinivibrionales bacterium]|nr:hypothetical protein [Chitinivibrionales bacterium]MBD3355828.1 hypothetical protein [Chitinivibrionales bacterium]
MNPFDALRALTLVTAVMVLRCVAPTEPVALGTGGSETETRVIGRAIDEHGTPLAGALVYLRSSHDELAAPADTALAVTDDSGAFVIDSLGIGNYLVEVVAASTAEPRAASQAFSIDEIDDGGTKFITVRLLPAGSIVGAVRFPDGYPQLRVDVFLRFEGFLVRRAFVDDSGNFSFPSLCEGTYTVSFEPADSALLRFSYSKKVNAGEVTDLGFVKLISAEDVSCRPNYIADTTAVRCLLDANGLFDLPVGEVVTVSAEPHRIVELLMAHRGLDTLPAEITGLAALEYLDLRHNALTHLPESIGSMSTLKDVLVDGNLLPSLPDGIGELPSLRTLSATGNVLERLPETIGSLSSMVRLHLDNNRLTTIPGGIGGLVSLELLSLDNNRLTTLPAEVRRLARLRRLSVKGNWLVDVPEGLGELTRLRELLLDDNDLVTIPDGIGNLDGLEMLWVGRNSLKKLPGTLGRCESLLVLNLCHNELTSLPDDLGDLAHLATLDLAENRLSALPSTLAQCTTVANLNLTGNRLCALPAELEEWADERDPGWRGLQECGADTAAPITIVAPNSYDIHTPGDTLTIVWQVSPHA